MQKVTKYPAVSLVVWYMYIRRRFFLAAPVTSFTDLAFCALECQYASPSTTMIDLNSVFEDIRQVLDIFAVRRNYLYGACLVKVAAEQGAAECVAAPVCHAAARVVTERSEASSDKPGVIRSPRGRSKPHVPVNTRGGRLSSIIARARGTADVYPCFLNLSDPSAIDHPVKPVVVTPYTLAAAREYTPETAGNLDHLPALADNQRLGLLAVNVLAVLHCRDRDDRVPVVGRTDEYHIDIVTGNDIAEVLVSFAVLIAVSAVNSVPGLIAVIFHYVTNRHNLDIPKAHEAAHVAAALAAHTDTPHDDTVVGAKHLRINKQWGSQSSGRTFLKEITSCYIAVFCHNRVSYC